MTGTSTHGEAGAHSHGADADPTANVTSILEAAVQRQDDLRQAESDRSRLVGELRAQRHDDLRGAESRHVAEMLQLVADQMRREMENRDAHTKELRLAEAARLDAIRDVDAAAVASAAAVQATAAAALAAQVTASAEAVRTQVAATAAAAATATTTASAAQAASQAQALAPIQEALAGLQRFQYEFAGGKAQVVETRDATADLKPILDAIASLKSSQSEGIGGRAQVVETRAGASQIWQAAGVIIAVLSLIAFALITILSRTR